jgi:hypothetical protein
MGRIVHALLLPVFMRVNILGQDEINFRVLIRALTETKFHTQTKCFKFSLRTALQLNPPLKFLWRKMDMNAKLRKILKLSTFSNLKWGRPSNWGTLSGSSTVCCMFGNSNSGCHLVFVGEFQPKWHNADRYQNMGGLFPLCWYIFMGCLEAGTSIHYLRTKKTRVKKALFPTGHGVARRR